MRYQTPENEAQGWAWYCRLRAVMLAEATTLDPTGRHWKKIFIGSFKATISTLASALMRKGYVSNDDYDLSYEALEAAARFIVHMYFRKAKGEKVFAGSDDDLWARALRLAEDFDSFSMGNRTIPPYEPPPPNSFTQSLFEEWWGCWE